MTTGELVEKLSAATKTALEVAERAERALTEATEKMLPHDVARWEIGEIAKAARAHHDELAPLADDAYAALSEKARARAPGEKKAKARKKR